jgi:hypothetical protein
LSIGAYTNSNKNYNYRALLSGVGLRSFKQGGGAIGPPPHRRYATVGEFQRTPIGEKKRPLGCGFCGRVHALCRSSFHILLRIEAYSFIIVPTDYFLSATLVCYTSTKPVNTRHFIPDAWQFRIYLISLLVSRISILPSSL